jgi:hypothetical protein
VDQPSRRSAGASLAAGLACPPSSSPT